MMLILGYLRKQFYQVDYGKSTYQAIPLKII